MIRYRVKAFFRAEAGAERSESIELSAETRQDLRPYLRDAIATLERFRPIRIDIERVLSEDDSVQSP